MPTPKQEKAIENVRKAFSDSAQTNTTSNNPLLDAITEQLTQNSFNESGLVSSADSGIDKLFAKAKEGIVSGQEASTKRIESQYNRAINEAQVAGLNRIDTAREKQRGYAQNISALRELTDSTEKTVKDLEQRKQELILAGEANAAQQISNLVIQELQFQQQAKQQAFNNLLSIGGFTLEKQKEDRIKEQQSANQRARIAEIGLKYGIPIYENDTIESVASRASGVASKIQKQELAKLVAETKRAEAEAQKAAQGLNFKFDDMTAEVMANTIDRGLRSGDPTQMSYSEILLQNVVDKQGGDAGRKVLGKIQKIRDIEFSRENLIKSIVEDLKTKSVGEIAQQIENMEQTGIMTLKQAETAREILKSHKPAPQSISFSGIFERVSGKASELRKGYGELFK